MEYNIPTIQSFSNGSIIIPQINSIDPHEFIKYMDYLLENINKLISHNDYLTCKLNDTLDWVEFNQNPESISYIKWLMIKDNETELQKIKREMTINEVIK